MISLRGLTKPGRVSNVAGGAPRAADVECCDLCGLDIPPDHRHLLHLAERRIVCSCEACWAMRAARGKTAASTRDNRPVSRAAARIS